MKSWERDRKNLEFQMFNNKNFFLKLINIKIELVAVICKVKSSKRKSKDFYKKTKVMVKN